MRRWTWAFLMMASMWFLAPTLDEMLPACDFTKHVGSLDGGFYLNCTSLNWASDDGSGTTHNQISFRPLQYSTYYMSNTRALALEDPRIFDPTAPNGPELRAAYNALRDQDSQKSFTFP